MCGRFYIDDGMAEEINKIIRNMDLKITGTKEVFPTNSVPIITGEAGQKGIMDMIWGFKHFDPEKKSVLINARSETVLERRMFKDSVMNRRCVIPTAGFYEWDKDKHKIGFMADDSKVLYLAGFWKSGRFIILTTQANHSIEDVHDRMPLTLERDEIENWLFDPESYRLTLQKRPGNLKRALV